jgi:hypothetical protein
VCQAEGVKGAGLQVGAALGAIDLDWGVWREEMVIEVPMLVMDCCWAVEVGKEDLSQ